MKCIITTRAHPQRFKALKLARSLTDEILVVCDSQEQRQRLLKLGVAHEEIRVTGIPPTHGLTNIAAVRQCIQDNYVGCNEWYMTLDDNVTHLTGLPQVYHEQNQLEDIDDPSKQYRKLFDVELKPEQAKLIIEQSLKKAAEIGAPMVGFAIETNYLFRRNHWQYWGYVRTQFSLQRNVGLSWNPFIGCMFEDMVTSVEAVAKFGTVLINRFMKPMKQAFEPGGIGTFEQREPHLKENCKWLMDKYPGLIDYLKDRSYSLTFSRRSQRTVNQWRCMNGYHDMTGNVCKNCTQVFAN